MSCTSLVLILAFFSHLDSLLWLDDINPNSITKTLTVADKITDIKSDAAFVLLVEKEAAYMRMAEDRFYHKYPCIIITAKGQPDVAR